MRRVVAFLLIVIVSVGCATKLEQARSNIQQTWRIDTVFQNGQDITVSYKSTRVNYRITFNKDNDFQESYQLSAGGDEVSVSGTWDFSDGVSRLTMVDNNQTRIYQVDKLDEDNLNLSDLGANSDLMIQYVPN